MTKQAPGGDAGPIDEVCNKFEAEWLAGRPPPIEPYLARVTPPQEDALLRELLALDVEYRLRRGERPGVGEYQPGVGDFDRRVADRPGLRPLRAR